MPHLQPEQAQSPFAALAGETVGGVNLYKSQKEAAQLLGLSSRQVSNLVEAGIPTRLQSGKRQYPWPKALHWYIEWKSLQAQRNQEPADFAKARARKTEAEASLAEIELKAAEGRYITRADYETALDAICERMAGVIRAVPSKYLTQIMVARGEVESQAVGEKIRDETLAALRGDEEAA